MPKITKKTADIKVETKQVPNPLDLSARFLSARPDLVGAWIIGAHGILPIFKSEQKDAIYLFMQTLQVEFFSALKAIWEKKHPEQKMTYTFGTICRNKKGEERLIIGLTPQENKKPTYEYMADNGVTGACNESSMTGWMEK